MAGGSPLRDDIVPSRFSSVLISLAFMFVIGLGAVPRSAAGQDSPVWTLLPEKTLVPSFLADPLEARFMVLKAMNESTVDVSLGDVWDLVRWDGRQRRAGFDRAALGIGGAAIMQFFIQHNRDVRFVTLPFGFREITGFDLAAGDYYMGMYVAAERRGRIRSRLRVHLNHVSAHLSDGLFDAETSSWMDGREPRRYSRESLQILIDVEFRSGFRGYVEGSRLYLHDELDGRIFPWWARGGAEYRHQTTFPVKPWAAVDVRTFDVDEQANGPLGIRLIGGLRLGNWKSRGISAVISHYRGPNWRGQYYNEASSEWHVGLYTVFR